jgi:hypothetical protein
VTSPSVDAIRPGSEADSPEEAESAPAEVATATGITSDALSESSSPLPAQATRTGIRRARIRKMAT